ncbi:ATPase family associated with various cellular activities (AAA) domain-containing protein [Ditylenchus destructor]|nr:ATPase family associated with various cellular activities (AAA) domain-containing protein [Ditylenchus destructor]
MSIPWVEKYRPRTLKDIVGNTMMIQRFMEFAKVGNVPNLIISGPPGCGKTTSVWALARDMLGAQVKDACLELNASDERGIDVVRERIKQFASRKVTLPPGKHKIVILDEADSMTDGAQQALRRIMEIHSGTTRFAFACNQSDKIIEPLQSRCAIVKYGKPDGLEAILFTAQGDMRQALNNLQCTVAGYGKVTKEAVFKVCDEPHPEKLREMFELCVHGEVFKAFGIMNELYRLGYSVDDLMTSMFKLVKVIDVPEALRLEFIIEIGKCHALVVQGLTTRIQLAGLVARLCHAHQKLADSS